MSWSIVGQNISRSLISQGHSIDLFSTNGIQHFPEDLKNNLIGYREENTNNTIGKDLQNDYDCQLTYTAMKNFPMYLRHGNKNRFGIWCYEFAGKNALPTGFAKNYRYCDKLLPPSTFAKNVFFDSGVPESIMDVIPHGINFDDIDAAIPYKLNTKKSTKILVPLAQLHRRKNIDGILSAYGKAFSKKDDVCLVLKIQDKTPTQPFELSFRDIFNRFKEKYKNHAEIEVIKHFIPNMFSLYKSCDIVFSASHCEAFGMTGLEALSLGLINIAPKYGGFLDFLNSDNSLLIEGKEFRVPANHLYWHHNNNTIAFMPDIDDNVSKLRFAVNNKNNLLELYNKNINIVRENYNWDTIAKNIMSLAI